MTDQLPADAVRTMADGTVELSLAAKPESVSLARAYVKQRWADFDGEVLDDVELIVSELVANAVQHGSPDIVLRLRAEPFAIDVAVLDHGAGAPVRRPAAEVLHSGHGRGLTIVDRLAAAWGYEPLEGEVGKIVWASIDRV